MKKTLKKLAAFTLAATMLAGCSGPSTSTTATTAAQKAAAAVTETTAASAETTAAVEAVDYKDHIVIGCNDAISKIQPHDKDNMMHAQLFYAMYNTLVTLDEETLEVLPELATEWEWKDDLTFEMKLRDDVTFHDGSKFTAADVVYSFDYMIGKEASRVASLEKVEAIDDYSIRMTMKTPNVDWELSLTEAPFSILSKSACEADPEAGATIGTGPWKLDSWTSGDYVDLVRNDAYWGEIPKTEKLTFRYISEGSARVIALQNGEVDVCLGAPQTDASYIADDPNLELIQKPISSLRYLTFDTSEGPGADQNLRLAIAHLINIDDIVTVATNGVGLPAVSEWGTNTFGYYDGFGAYEYNPELAKEYLEKSYPNGGAKIKIMCAANEYKTILSIIQEEARAIGLEIEIEQVESATQSAMSKFDAHEHEAICYSLSWAAPGDTARKQYYEGSDYNKAILTNERVMELCDLALSEFDTEKRKEYYKEIQELNHEQAWYIPLYYSVNAVGINKDLTGLQLATTGRHDLSYVAVAE